MNEDLTQGTGGSVFRTPLIEQVHQGMEVADAAGEKLGRVEYVQMGDPQAVTTQGEDYQTPGVVRDVVRSIVGSEPDVPEPLHSRLLRSGFIKIDGPGFISNGRSVSAEQIRSISGDTVTLAASKDQLIDEAGV